jgi:hypothetical protein
MHEYRKAVLRAAEEAYEAGQITLQDRRRIRLFCLLSRFNTDFVESKSTVELELAKHMNPAGIIDWGKFDQEDWIEFAKIILQIIALIASLT